MSRVDDIRVHLTASNPSAQATITATEQNNVVLSAEHVREVIENDYRMLRNIPTINGVPVIGNKTLSDFRSANVSINTTEAWRAQPDYIPAAGEIVIFTDKETIEQDGEVIPIPGIKVGDGKAYALDLPFVDSGSEALKEHMADGEIHINQEERTRWNNKLNYVLNDEELIFNRL